jgi:hypothetical protein
MLICLNAGMDELCAYLNDANARHPPPYLKARVLFVRLATSACLSSAVTPTGRLPVASRPAAFVGTFAGAASLEDQVICQTGEGEVRASHHTQCLAQPDVWRGGHAPQPETETDGPTQAKKAERFFLETTPVT